MPEAAAAEALWWERHIVEVLRGVPPQAPPGTGPKPEYDPALVSLTRREQAKAAELTAAGQAGDRPARSRKRRAAMRPAAWRRWPIAGPAGLSPPHGRADPRVVEAMRQAIGEAHRTPRGRRLTCSGGPGRSWRPRTARGGGAAVAGAAFTGCSGPLSAGKHTTGSARTRRSLAARPDGPFSQPQPAAPGEVMEIDSTPLDVLVRLDDGVEGRVELTGMIDVATRTVTAAVLQPTAKSADASVLLARTVTPEPMRPGWATALAMSASALPLRGGCATSTPGWSTPPPGR